MTKNLSVGLWTHSESTSFGVYVASIGECEVQSWYPYASQIESFYFYRLVDL